MTLGEKLAHVAANDPDFARSARRLRLAGWIFGVGLLAAIGVALWAVAVNFSQQTEIRKVQSACTTDPDGAECQSVKRKSDEERNVASTCVLFYKVDRGGQLLKLTKCPVKEVPRSATVGASAPAQVGSETTSAPGEAGNSGPDPAVNDGGPRHEPPSEPGGGGNGGDADPPSAGPGLGDDPSQAPTVVTPPASSGGDSDPGDPQKPGVIPQTVEAAGNAAADVVEAAGNAADKALCTATSVLGPCPGGSLP